jgi:hypothetical protein
LKDSERKHPDPTTPFERFEDLTKRLLSVPKKEAGAKAEEFKRRKSKKPR